MSAAGDGGIYGRLVVLGCGSSSSTPTLACMVRPEGPCPVCSEALANPASRNRRGNPMLLLTYGPDSSPTHIMFDCGKTFRESALRFFPKLGVRHLDAVIVSHDHADAILGIDDLRDLQKFDFVKLDNGMEEKRISGVMPIYVSRRTDKRAFV